MRTNFEARVERVNRLRLSTQDRLLARWERDERKAAAKIGELCRDGVTVYYVFPSGGKYFESASHTECCEYLSRNGYLR